MTTPRQFLVQFVEHDITQQWTQGTALRHTFLRFFVLTCNQYASIQVFVDKRDHPPVLYRPADYLYQFRVVHIVKELLQVQVNAEAVAIIDDGLRASQGLVGASMRTEAKTVITELRFVQRLQDLRYTLLD